MDTVALLQHLGAGNANVTSVLQSLWPSHREYRALLRERRRISRAPDENSTLVPAGAVLRPGESDPRIVLLKQRLLGPGDYSPRYDATLMSAVTAFQQSSGIETDGIVGPATLEVLNASRFSWIDRIDANLERWRWLPDAVPRTHLRVNIAAFQLRAIRDGREELAMKVIVGRPFRQTPVFQRDLRYLVVNPFWNLPASIARRDKLPLLQENALALAAQGYEARATGSDTFVPVTDIDWQEISASNFRYQLRQRPGPDNALGNLKFMLPNEYAVYLHGTPDIELFDRQERSFSSGCIRLADPSALARWLLIGDGLGEQAAGLVGQIESGNTVVHYLKTPVAVLIVYFTAFLDGDNVVFRRDLYQRDRALTEALRRNH